MSTSHVLELLPVVRSSTQRAWIECATDQTVRGLRRFIREARATGVGVPRGYAHLVEGDAHPDPPSTGVSIEPDRNERVIQLAVSVPPAVRSLLDYTIDLVRRVAGSHASVATCFEHILAEYACDEGDFAPDEPIEQAETYDLHRDEARPSIGPSAPIRVPRVLLTEPPPDPLAIDRHLRTLIHNQQTRHGALAELLLQARESRTWADLGFRSFSAYCRDALDVSPRFVQQMDRIRRKLASLPELRCAHRSGRVGWSKLRLLVSVCTPNNEKAWIHHAERITLRYLEREIEAAHQRVVVDPTDDLPRPLQQVPPYGSDSALRPGAELWKANTSTHGAARCRVQIPVSLPTYAIWRSVDASIGERLGPNAQPWERLLLLLRHFLDQWDRPAYEKWSEGAEIHATFGWMCAVPGCTARRNLEQHHIVYRSQGGADDATNLVSLCARHHRYVIHEQRAVSVEGRSPHDLRWTFPFGHFLGDVREDPHNGRRYTRNVS